jgi:hypothetical protein
MMKLGRWKSICVAVLVTVTSACGDRDVAPEGASGDRDAPVTAPQSTAPAGATPVEAAEPQLGDGAPTGNEEGGTKVPPSDSDLQKILSDYRLLQADLSASRFRYQGGRVVVEGEGELTPADRAALELFAKAVAEIDGKVIVPEGVGVVARAGERTTEVIFGLETLPPGTRSGDYAAKVVFDSQTGRVLEVLGSP